MPWSTPPAPASNPQTPSAWPVNPLSAHSTHTSGRTAFGITQTPQSKEMKPQQGRGRVSHPNIPKPVPLLQPQIRIPRTTIPLDLPCPVAPANRLQLLRTQNQSNRDNDHSHEGFDDDILRQGGSRVAKEDGVFVRGVASAEDLLAGAF